jgi:hypothetical protein
MKTWVAGAAAACHIVKDGGTRNKEGIDIHEINPRTSVGEPSGVVTLIRPA